MQTPIIVATAVCALLVGCHLYFDTLKPSIWSNHIQHTAAAAAQKNNPVLSVLEHINSDANISNILAQQRDGAIHDTHCCHINGMQGVLASAAAFQHTAAFTQADQGPEKARELMLLFRLHLAKQWAAALQPVVSQITAAGTSNSSSCRCRSVQLAAARSQSSNDSTTILLVLNSWSRLDHQLQLYSANLLMLWSYARLHGYGLHIYVHGTDLPPWMPVYFIKPPGILQMMQDLSYQHVMYCDWDVLLSPHTAPPLSLFYNEYPQASLLLQGEYNLCAGANLWRNTAAGRALLLAWWELGARGCCPTTQHDQSALKHMISAYLANFTGDDSLYGPTAQQHFQLPAALPPPPAQHGGGFAVLSTEAPPTVVSTWLQVRPVLQAKGSAIGLVGLDVHYRSRPGRSPVRMALHNCMGLWWGCIPPNTPALLHHTGHGNMEKLEPEWLAQRLVNNLLDWLQASQLGLNVQAQ